MMESHDLAALTARLGVPHLEQLTHPRGEAARMVVYWGCGCTGMGTEGPPEGGSAVRWTRCDHHAAEEIAFA
jgi:hypothetical protein